MTFLMCIFLLESFYVDDSLGFIGKNLEQGLISIGLSFALDACWDYSPSVYSFLESSRLVASGTYIEELQYGSSFLAWLCVNSCLLAMYMIFFSMFWL